MPWHYEIKDPETNELTRIAFVGVPSYDKRDAWRHTLIRHGVVPGDEPLRQKINGQGVDDTKLAWVEKTTDSPDGVNDSIIKPTPLSEKPKT